MAFVPIAMMVVSAAVSAYGAIQQGKTQSANAKAAASAANYNAAIETQNANTASAVATSREQQVRMQNQERMGAVRAAMAESGGFGGTNAGVENQSAVSAEYDALQTRYSGILQSNNLRNQSALDIYQGKVDTTNAKSAQQAGYWNATSDILSGATSIYGYQNNARIPRMGGSGY